MLYTKLGETALNVSRLAFGTWQAGGDWGAPQEENLKAAIRRALDLGINFLDTAQANGVGASECLLGEALEPAIKSRWVEVILATKGGLQIERRPDHIQGTAPAAEFDLSEEDLREIENIMQGAVPVGGPSPEGM
jgi:aryl-alcohol dehydrogenase-like predicted oxidoreductase